MTSVRVSAKLDGATKGKVWFYLWREGAHADFPRFDKGKPIASASVPIAAPAHEFTGVAPGTYAISSFHDEKETGQIETNFIGMPKCALGVSGTPSSFGPPAFDKCKFTVGSEPAQVAIQLRKIF